jgi:hypothetical protein
MTSIAAIMSPEYYASSLCTSGSDIINLLPMSGSLYPPELTSVPWFCRPRPGQHGRSELTFRALQDITSPMCIFFVYAWKTARPYLYKVNIISIKNILILKSLALGAWHQTGTAMSRKNWQCMAWQKRGGGWKKDKIGLCDHKTNKSMSKY